MRGRARLRADVAPLAMFARGLRSYLRTPLSPEAGRARIEHGLRTRETSFLGTLERSVFRNPRSPYRALLAHAGIELGDVAHLVREAGLEATLQELRDAGVYVTLEEFKGRRPIVRSGLELAPALGDFDNPVPGAAIVGRTGGSRGEGRRLLVDLEHLEQESVYHALFDEAHGAGQLSTALWRPVPPGYAGIYYALSFAKIGKRLERWFSQNGLSSRPAPGWDALSAVYTVLASRGTPTPIPFPEQVPVSEAVRVARWLAERRRAGVAARLNTTASCGVRVAEAARDAGLDIDGTLFVLGGEPLTEAKASAVRRVGGTPVCGYYMTEAGRIGITCAAPSALDDVHVVSDKLAVIQRERPVASGGRVRSFLLSALLPSSPKVLLNTETDDYGTLEERSCGCPVGEAGLTLHIHGIRSFEKLSSEGMSFLGSDVLALVEQILPARFGGGPLDYQLVEEEAGGLPRVTIVVSERVGPVDEGEVVHVTLEALGAGQRSARMMAGIWRTAETLRVARREPYTTSAGKSLPLHILEGSSPSG